MSTPNKIRATHLERTAIVYVRQSTPAQVRDNPESRARQYALVEEAAQLGWPASKIEVIDADLGISGRSAERRSGFREVVSRVCLGEVGAIFGLEVARLARSNADLARLLELARLTDTLVIDTDGMYDLREFNDRLLLGLKGAMSEAELYILAGRLQGAKRAAAERGELRSPLPVGYVRDADDCTPSSILTRRSARQSRTCSLRSRQPAPHMEWSAPSSTDGFRVEPMEEHGLVSCAGVG